MWNDALCERVQVASLRELDALVGTRLTQETPITHWEDSRTHFRFSSIEEAIEALHDPYFKQFEPGSAAVFVEVKEYRRYSENLDAAWYVVESLSQQQTKPLVVLRRAGNWEAAFGDGPSVGAPTAPLAICLAALLARGIVVEFEPGCGCGEVITDYSKS
jgi:Phage ABA sandwich domain